MKKQFQPKTFANKLLELRKEKDLTQNELGNAVGVNKRFVSAWENGTAKPSLESVIALSDFFGVSIDYLLFDNVPREGIEAINDFQLYEYFRKVDLLPEGIKQIVKEVVDGLVFKHKVKEIPEADFVATQEEPRTQPLRKVAGRR